MKTTDSAYYLGIDLGGTSIKGGLVSAEGAVKAEASRRTPVEEGREGILRELLALVKELLEAAGLEKAPVAAIGIGSAGRIDPASGTVLYATDNLPGWTGTPLRELVEAQFGLPVYVDNDVNVAAIGEAWLGMEQDDPSVTPSPAPVVFVALGTGVGGAVVYGGSLIHGAAGGAGEVGHMILRPEGHPCGCGQRGCLEQYVSGTALNRTAKLLDHAWNSRVLLEKCAGGEPRAVEAVQRFAADLATGLITIRNMLDPQKIIIGGGLSDSHAMWWDYLTDSLAAQSGHRTAVERARLGNRAGLIGAARLAMNASATGGA